MSKSTPQSPANGANFAPQDFLSQMQQMMAPWATMAQQQLDRWLSTSEQMAAWQREGVERMEAATDEVGKLVKSSLSYSAKLAEHACTTSVDATRRCLDLAGAAARSTPTA
jgi:hypothetical protein